MSFIELLEVNPALLYGCVALISLCIGSLLNVVIYRLPIMLHTEWKQQCEELLGTEQPSAEKTINLFLPRSFCIQCSKTIKAWHNIPILSYLLLRGRCHQCHTKISLRYPLIELLTCLLSLYTTWHFGFSAQLLCALLFIWLLIPAFFIDLEYQLLPDCLTLGLLWLGLLVNTQNLFTSLSNAVFSAAGAYLSLWLFIKLFYLIRGKIGMGHGDFKLFAALGAWFGITLLPLILLLSSLSGAIIGSVYLKVNHQSQNTMVPFGPFLCFAGIIALFWGHNIMNWYQQLCHI